LLAQPKGGRGAAAPLKTLGEMDGKPVTLHQGRYGPYASCNGVHATLPKDSPAESVTLDEAIALIRAKAAKGPAPKGAAAKKPAAKKAPAKATTAKKPAAKKAPAKAKKTTEPA
jgi:DNA topoisomerase-1